MKEQSSAIGSPSKAVLASALDAIGNTPMVRLDRLTAEVDGTIVAKLEYLNPGGSKKDRIARRIIKDAERAGLLHPGQPVVEFTSGNTGAGLAIACGSRPVARSTHSLTSSGPAAAWPV
jgi:cysteine synthase